MADVPRSSTRGGVVLALVVVALFQVLPLVQGVHAVRRLQARVAEDAQQHVASARPRLDAALARGGVASWNQAALVAIELGAASEVDVLDGGDRVVYSRPVSAPVAYRLRPDQRERLARKGVLTVAAQDGPAVRVLTYLVLRADAPGFVLRLARPAGDLEDELRERQQVFLVHVVSLGVLGVAALFVLRRDPAPAGPAESALEVYEQAMERLRDHGEQVEARHEAERRRMEDAVREAEAMARAGELTAGIVHEVRNGLGTIVGYARMVERGAPPADAVGAATAIREECETLERVVRRFADFVRRDELQLAPVDLGRLLPRVAAREQHGHDGVETRVVPREPPILLQADEALLERAFENVVRNAVQAAAAGGGRVVIDTARVDGEVQVSVEDDGPGLAADHPGAIRPFYSTRAGGLGLGLPLARKIVLLHGGELRLEPRVPRGLRVVLAFPDTAA